MKSNNQELSQIFDFLNNAMLGFNQTANQIQMACEHKQPNYPPYNIVQIEENKYLIEIAVAGIPKDDIAIMFERGLLTVAHKKSEAKEGTESLNYLCQGLSARSFERKFYLHEFVEVKSAACKDGILKIELEKVIPEDQKPRSIEINAS